MFDEPRIFRTTPSATTSTMITTSTSKAVCDPPASNKMEIKQSLTFNLHKLSDERSQTLLQLLEKGHKSVAPLREPALMFHSHLPHILGSAYSLGANSKQLVEFYEHETSQMIKLDDKLIRGNAISRENWRDHLQQKPYTAAFADFFDKEVRENNGDWRKVVEDYLYSGAEPLVNGFTGGVIHPLIHLAYAYEFHCKEVATEALSLASTEYSPLHKLIDHYPPDNSTYKTTSLAEILQRIRQDKRFDGMFIDPGYQNTTALMQNPPDAIIEHWNAWELVDIVQQLEQCCDLSLLLAISTGSPAVSFDFFFAHTMTSAHGLRISWQYFPEERLESILRQWSLLVIVIYIAQIRPYFGVEQIESVELLGRDWQWVTNTALSHRFAFDSHFFKVVRAPKAFGEIFGQKNDLYLKAAIKFINEFKGWEGFGPVDEGHKEYVKH